MPPSSRPRLTHPETVLGALDFAGVAVFAATGALAAAREKHDLVTFAFFAAITGVGGGTLRDLLIDPPVFWVQDWRYIAVCLAAALAVWLVGAARLAVPGPAVARCDRASVPMASWARPRPRRSGCRP